eukprot:365777-Chlamydomonas_euryale.AAC.5
MFPTLPAAQVLPQVCRTRLCGCRWLRHLNVTPQRSTEPRACYYVQDALAVDEDGDDGVASDDLGSLDGYLHQLGEEDDDDEKADEQKVEDKADEGCTGHVTEEEDVWPGAPATLLGNKTPGGLRRPCHRKTRQRAGMTP